jgi:hypothetical protein
MSAVIAVGIVAACLLGRFAVLAFVAMGEDDQ